MSDNTDAKSDPRDKFLYNGHPTRQAMLEENARQEEFRHQCEVKYLLSMPKDQLMKAIALREEKRGKEAVARLREDLQKARPGCLNKGSHQVWLSDAMTPSLF